MNSATERFIEPHQLAQAAAFAYRTRWHVVGASRWLLSYRLRWWPFRVRFAELDGDRVYIMPAMLRREWVIGNDGGAWYVGYRTTFSREVLRCAQGLTCRAAAMQLSRQMKADGSFVRLPGTRDESPSVIAFRSRRGE